MTLLSMRLSITQEELASIWNKTSSIREKEKYIINIDQEANRLTLSSPSREIILEEDTPNELYEANDQYIMKNFKLKEENI